MEKNYVPSDASLMECLVAHEVLQRVRRRVLEGIPSGVVIDQAIEEVVRKGSTSRARVRGESPSPSW